MIKYLLIICTIIILTIISVNSFSEAPSTAYNAKKCSRYCHNVQCLHHHHQQKYNNLKNSSVFPLLQRAYTENIVWLKNNPFGLSYKVINLLIYVVAMPLIALLLLWGATRKKH